MAIGITNTRVPFCGRMLRGDPCDVAEAPEGGPAQRQRGAGCVGTSGTFSSSESACESAARGAIPYQFATSPACPPTLPERSSKPSAGVTPAPKDSRNANVMPFREVRGKYCRLCSVLLTLGSLCGVLAASRDAAAQRPTLLPAHQWTLGEPLYPIPDLSALTMFHIAEAIAWSADFASWQRWMDEWASQTEPGLLSGRDWRMKPVPPAWLPAVCGDLPTDEAGLVDACARLSEWRDDVATSRFRRDNVRARGQREHQTRTSWLQHIHLDALWPIGADFRSSIGVVGTHATMEIHGRLQVFLAPGLMMLNLPSATGRAWTPAVDYGLAYRLGRFTIPGTSTRATAHINLAKAWVIADVAGVGNGTVDLAGFSFTFARPPRTSP